MRSGPGWHRRTVLASGSASPRGEEGRERPVRSALARRHANVFADCATQRGRPGCSSCSRKATGASLPRRAEHQIGPGPGLWREIAEFRCQEGASGGRSADCGSAQGCGGGWPAADLLPQFLPPFVGRPRNRGRPFLPWLRSAGSRLATPRHRGSSWVSIPGLGAFPSLAQHRRTVDPLVPDSGRPTPCETAASPAASRSFRNHRLTAHGKR